MPDRLIRRIDFAILFLLGAAACLNLVGAILHAVDGHYTAAFLGALLAAMNVALAVAYHETKPLEH